MVNGEFPNIRSASPIVIEIEAGATEIFNREMFGPIAFIIPTANTEESLRLAAESAKKLRCHQLWSLQCR